MKITIDTTAEIIYFDQHLTIESIEDIFNIYNIPPHFKVKSNSEYVNQQNFFQPRYESYEAKGIDPLKWTITC